MMNSFSVSSTEPRPWPNELFVAVQVEKLLDVRYVSAPQGVAVTASHGIQQYRLGTHHLEAVHDYFHEASLP
eukprot:6216051-Amphidinium_carterae.1